MAAQKYCKVVAESLAALSRTGIYSSVVKHCRLVSASEGRVSVEFDVSEPLTNSFGTLHGGCSATLVDIVTTAALISTPQARAGVSVDLHVTYLSAAKLGDTVQLDAEVIRVGRTLGFTRALLSRKSDGVLIATGLHTKAFPPVADKGLL